MALSKDRLIASLIYSNINKKEDSEIIPFGYELDHIDYRFNPTFLIDKVNKYFEDDFIRNEYLLSDEEKKNYTFVKIKDNNELFHSVETFFGENISITESLNSFFSDLKLSKTEKLSEIQKNAISYLLYKMFWISRKYNAYKKYYKAFVYTSGKLQISSKKIFKEFANKVRIRDSSHVVKKAYRIYFFLKISDKLENSFEYLKNYLLLLKKEGPIESPIGFDWTLPPSIFSYELFLKKRKESNNSSASIINYKNLSSGQIQLLQTISVHLYHIGNVISNLRKTDNPEPSVSYNKINLVFDEVEICFHPEFQRIFIKYLISMIKNLYVLNDCAINIFILSHSPFILSDIPKGRVLYLEDGEMNNEKTNKSTFAGNIGEMVYESFFMKSSIGAFAEDKLKELIEYKMCPFKTNVNYDMYLQNISDTVTKSLIEEIEASDDKNRN